MNIILRQIQERNIKVLKKVWLEHAKSLMCYALVYLNNTERSEDLVSDVFADLWNNAKNLEIEMTIEEYLFEEVRNRCLQYFKKFDLTDEHGTADYLGRVASIYYPKIEGPLPNKLELYRLVKNQININKSIGHKCFHLWFVDGKNVNDISIALNVHIDVVKKELYQVKAEILKAINYKTN